MATDHPDQTTTDDGEKSGERFSGGGESVTHLWGKLMLHRRQQTREQPWFRGNYRYERTVADCVADCLITDKQPEAWIECVVSRNRYHRDKTRLALQFGYPIYWVFLDGADDARQTARRELSPELKQDITFGTFDPERDILTLGDAVTFENYRLPIESQAAFKVTNVLGYRAGAAHVPQTEFGFDLGWISIAGDRRRVYTAPADDRAWLARPDRPLPKADAVDLTDDTSWLAQRIEAGEVERIGPIPATSTLERRSYGNIPAQDPG